MMRRFRPAGALPALVPLAFLAMTLRAALPAAAQVTFGPDSSEVTELERLHRAAGRSFPVAGFPISGSTLAGYAQDLGQRPEGAALGSELQAYLDRLGWVPGSLQLGIDGRLAFEGYLRAGSPQEDFRHEYLEREHLAELSMGLSRPDRAALFIQGMLHREYQGVSDWNLPSPAGGNPLALENRQVTKGYLWYDFQPLQLELGRDKVHFGPLRSSLLPSAQLPFLDLLRLTLPLGRLAMDFMICSLENTRAVEEAAVVEDPDGLGYSFAEDGVPGVTVILASLHRFEYDFGFLRAAVTGMCVYAREDNAFVLADFFPVFSWHASDIMPNNLSLVFDAEAVLFPGFRLMAQFGFDDISTTGAGAHDSSAPTIHAGIAGCQYTRALGFAVLDLYAEAGYTHYLWGSFNDEWYLGRAVYRLELDQGTRALPLTSPYGPGAVWTRLEAGLEDWGGFTARLAAELVFRNPEASLTGPYAADASVAGAGLEGGLRLEGELRFHRWKWWEAWARPVVFYRYFGRDSGSWLELTLGAAVELDWRRPIRHR